MYRGAVVENGIVVNTIVLASPEDAAEFNAIHASDVVQTGWSYADGQFTPPPAPPENLNKVKQSLLRWVDTNAETARSKYITPGSGQAMTYQAKAAEALRYAETNGAGEYPFLSLEVGITGNTLADVAAVVLAMHNQWQSIGAAIEQVRLSAKAQIDAAQDEVTARAVVPVWPSL